MFPDYGCPWVGVSSRTRGIPKSLKRIRTEPVTFHDQPRLAGPTSYQQLSWNGRVSGYFIRHFFATHSHWIPRVGIEGKGRRRKRGGEEGKGEGKLAGGGKVMVCFIFTRRVFHFFPLIFFPCLEGEWFLATSNSHSQKSNASCISHLTSLKLNTQSYTCLLSYPIFYTNLSWITTAFLVHNRKGRFTADT